MQEAATSAPATLEEVRHELPEACSLRPGFAVVSAPTARPNLRLRTLVEPKLEHFASLLRLDAAAAEPLWRQLREEGEAAGEDVEVEVEAEAAAAAVSVVAAAAHRARGPRSRRSARRA